MCRTDDDGLPTCSICLNPVRSTRGSTPIRCGHVFHKRCIDEWKARPNGHSCPVCRRVFDVSNFTVRFEIINNYTAVANSVSLNQNQIMDVFDVFELSMNFEDQIDLDSLLEDIGISIEELDERVLAEETRGGSETPSPGLPPPV